MSKPQLHPNLPPDGPARSVVIGLASFGTTIAMIVAHAVASGTAPFA